MGYHA